MSDDLLSISPREAMDDFLLNLRGTDRRANTIIYYRSALRQLVLWLEAENLGLRDLNARVIRRYFAAREDEGVSRTTQYHDFTACRLWFRFCVSERYIRTSPMGDLKYRKPRPGPVETPTNEQVQAILSAVRDRWDVRKNPPIKRVCPVYRTRVARRDYCLVLLVYLTGCRRSEAVGLELADVLDRDGLCPSVRFREAKTGDRVCPVTLAWIDALNAYLRVRPKSLSPALFLGEYNEPLSAHWFGKKFGDYAAFAGCPGVTLQWLRRHRSQALVKAGDLWTASQILGNSPNVLRQHYLADDPAHQREVWERSLRGQAITNRETRRRRV